MATESIPEREQWDMTLIMPRGWEYAASSPEAAGLKGAMKRSMEIEVERKHDLNPQLIEQMELSSEALARLLESGLWGSGPFTVSLSGSENVLYMAVTRR